MNWETVWKDCRYQQTSTGQWTTSYLTADFSTLFDSADEDAEDVRVALERLNDPNRATVPLDALKRELGFYLAFSDIIPLEIGAIYPGAAKYEATIESPRTVLRTYELAPVTPWYVWMSVAVGFIILAAWLLA